MFASACVAMAPTCGSAAGTPAPTARNFDCTATPHSAASRSQATIEYVDGLAILQLSEVELAELALLWRDEHASDLRALERCTHRIGRRSADDDGDSLRVRLLETAHVLHPVEDEGVVERDVVLALDGDLRHAPPRGAEPALPHSSTDSPGSGVRISTPLGACSLSWSGVPVSSGKVPQWQGRQRFVPSSSSATPASLGPIV